MSAKCLECGFDSDLLDEALEEGDEAWNAAIEAAARVAEAQPFYPDTNVGMRQQWVKDEIARKVRSLLRKRGGG